MHPVASFFLGLSLVPATLLLIFTYTFLGVQFKLDKSASVAGFATGFGLLILCAAAGIMYANYTLKS